MRELSHHRRYLLEEFAEDYLARAMPRRELLRRSLLATGSLTLTATTLFALGCASGDDDEPAAASTATEPAPPATEGAPASTATPPAEATATPGASPAPGAGDDEDETEAESVSFPGPASEILGYLARPSGEGQYPAVLVIHENRGLLPHFEDVARRYAAEGFVALVPDLVSRLGGTAVAAERLGQIQPDDLLEDLQASIDYLKAQSFVDANAIGVTGFCFGGGYAFGIAAYSPDIKAAVPYYGTARGAISIGLAETQAAVLVMYGENDTRITSERQDVEAVLQMTGRPYEIMVHADAGHAFFNDTGGSYNETAANAAWEATLAWFREHLAS